MGSVLDPALALASRAARRLRLIGLDRNIAETARGRPLVAGYLSAASGLGGGARSLLDALDEAGLRPAAFDLTPRLFPGRDVVDWRAGRSFAEDDGRGPVIVHANAPEAVYALTELGRDRLAGRMRIAYWAWEFERIPPSWRGAFGWFHEIWAPSRFTADAIAAARPPGPVRAVGYRLSAAPDPARVRAWRRELAGPDRWLALHIFDTRSSIDRKNTLGAIAAFQRAFAGRDDAVLALKAGSWGARPDSDARVREAIGEDARIRLLTDPLDEADMTALTAAADLVLAPHRSEGFGLMLAGALLAGTETVMTDWSASEAFAGLPGAHRIACRLVAAQDAAGVYAADAGRWAEPDLEAAARIVGEIAAGPRRENPERRAQIAAAAAERFALTPWLARLGDPFLERAAAQTETS